MPPNSAPISSPTQSPLSPKRQHAGRRGVQPHLVLDRDDADVVGLARIAVGVEPVFGHQEQRQPLGPGRRIGRAREDEVDDVVGHVVVAERDEDLRPLDAERPVAARRRAAAQRADVATRPAARSGSSCRSTRRSTASAGTAPAARAMPWCSSASIAPTVSVGREREAHVGGAQRLEHRGGQHERHPLPAERLGRPDRAPAAVDIGLVRGDEARRASRRRRSVHFGPAVSPMRSSGAHSPAANSPAPSSTASRMSSSTPRSAMPRDMLAARNAARRRRG